ncbi:hypothetical protein CS8_011630 [Cupriavidus sp. 8B]
MLYAVEKAFDQIASAIQGAAIASLADPVRAWRNDGLASCGSNRLHESVGVVALVRDRLRAQAFDCVTQIFSCAWSLALRAAAPGSR